ncbi:beta-lactamase class A [Kribbella amoyensis]|uniref:Beta-lactamase class A n=1 Tax=Kribbella amoyensis TaxID=996641 RepID=A0A561BRC8_9ACTN|nr:serine hydrolase [Kribbella amoyensis]TWD81399.1 beta-lactamase class A [Kribbella amoyensis]
MSTPSRLRALFEDAGTRGWLHAIRLGGSEGEVAVDADALVPMASVYKLPLLVAFCELVDRGALDPREQVTLEPSDRTAGPTGLSVLLDPVSMSRRDLALSMMTVSDNAAADALLDVVGLDRLADFLSRHGLTGTRIRRGTAGNLRDLLDRTRTDDPDTAFAVLADNDMTDPAGIYEAANASATTARDMTRLLGLIWSGEVLSAEQTAFVRRALGLQVFAQRLGSGFPHDAVRVFGKTGTFAALRHEVGVVELPDGSAYAVAVFTRAARGDRKLPRVDQAIGTAARLAVDTLR